jgi:beta-lactamase regulating signal transducer with metallopeptidase domain
MTVLLTFMVNAAVQGCVLAGIGLAALWLLPRSAPALRYRTVVATLILCVMIPAVASLVPDVTKPDVVSIVSDGLPEHQSQGVATATALLALTRSASTSWLSVLYIAIVVLRLLSLARASWQTAWLRKGSLPISSGPWRAHFARCSEIWGSQPIALCRSRHVSTPIVCGWLSPTIIVPDRLVDDDHGLGLAILGHEFAHIERRDMIKHLLLEILLAPIAFHPAVLVLKQRAMRYREMLCDERAVERLGLNRSTYARTLLRTAALNCGGSLRLAGVAQAAAARDLEVRIESMLAPKPAGSATAQWAFAIALLVLAAGLTPKFIVTVHAQDLDEMAGVWRLVAAESSPAAALPFTGVSMWIAVNGREVEIHQQRTRSDGAAETMHIRGSADGTPFQMVMPNGELVNAALQRRDGRLVADARFPGTDNSEHDEVFIRSERLVIAARRVQGNISRYFHFVFKRDAKG